MSDEFDEAKFRAALRTMEREAMRFRLTRDMEAVREFLKASTRVIEAQERLNPAVWLREEALNGGRRALRVDFPYFRAADHFTDEKSKAVRLQIRYLWANQHYLYFKGFRDHIDRSSSGE